MKKFINAKPNRTATILLGLLPFALLILVYMIGSDARLAINPSDKLLPSFSHMGESMMRMAFEPSRRTGDYLFWQDTLSSLTRLGAGVLIAACIGLLIGTLTGSLPYISASFSPLLTVISLVPPLALLPILFIVVGLGEVSKIALIAIGITPFIARDIQGRTKEIPSEQLVKAQTLGASTSQILIRVILPQIMPKLIDAVRLSLGAGWLFLIAAEAIASTDGLGYRIFLVRRYLSMDVILPYVAWITLLAFLVDYLLRKANQRLFPWNAEVNS
ncbi:ABC transporter permease [Marinomonas transparens]|uniref:ABC transporter permease n=1 Tax=Marinomonas transparens TaxID=2795388 RepID=A0A934JPB9_9GAMM|nr:ABC transporter permease [Marinomonas transparens]MBJ7537629.1 ABC transporter permease [Marinomonas transparens]